MEGLRHHLIRPLLLLVLLAGAVVITDAQSCEPTNLATQIARSCSPDMPKAHCCERLVALASVDRGGVVTCLCRVSAQPQIALARLNASHLMSLYAACGGLRTDGAHLAAACLGPPPSAVPVIAPPPPIPLRQQQTKFHCNSTLMAFELTQYCHQDMIIPTPRCCTSVLRTIDEDPNCLCRVVETGDMVLSDLDVRIIWDFYKPCGGRRQVVPKDRGNCAHASSPPPPPPPPPPQLPPPPPSPKTRHGISAGILVGIILGGIGLLAVLALAAYFVGHKVKSTKSKEHQSSTNVNLAESKEQSSTNVNLAKFEEQPSVQGPVESAESDENSQGDWIFPPPDPRILEAMLEQDTGIMPKKEPVREPERQRVRAYWGDTDTNDNSLLWE